MLYKIEMKRRELTQHIQNRRYEELVWSKKLVKTKQNKAKTFKILQDRRETNIFINDCEEEKAKKKKL